MKILWIKANKILPVHSGGDIRSFNILRHLAQKHSVVFISYYDGPEDEKYHSEIRSIFPEAEPFCAGTASSGLWSRIGSYAYHLPEQAPYAVSRFSSPVVRSRIKKHLGESNIDVVVCDFLDGAINFPLLTNVPTILFQHNVESEIWRRHTESEPNPIKRLAYRVEFRKMLRYEQAMLKKFDRVIAVSSHDKRLMDAWTDPSKIFVVPTGVSVEEYRPTTPRLEDQPIVMFVGAMDWEPNIAAVEYFASRIWPAVVREVPGACFRIVGRNPGRRVLALAEKSIDITGRVASVPRHLEEAAVVVVPITVGGGTRLKIYEAMAAGKAVVSTSVGAEGLDVNHDRDIVLADDASGFAVAVVNLLRDRNYRDRIANGAAKHVAQFDWKDVAEKFSHVLEEVCETSRVAIAA